MSGLLAAPDLWPEAEYANCLFLAGPIKTSSRLWYIKEVGKNLDTLRLMPHMPEILPMEEVGKLGWDFRLQSHCQLSITQVETSSMVYGFTPSLEPRQLGK